MYLVSAFSKEIPSLFNIKSQEIFLCDFEVCINAYLPGRGVSVNWANQEYLEAVFVTRLDVKNCS